MPKQPGTKAKTSERKTAAKAKAAKLRILDIVVAIVTVTAVGFGIWRIASHSASADRGKQACAQVGQEQQIALKDDSFTPASVTVNRCDRLVISNTGDQIYDLNLGTHDQHIVYPGFNGQQLRPGQYFTFEAIQPGSYPLHDHLRNKAKLQIIINK